jgi:hypothetical protein
MCGQHAPWSIDVVVPIVLVGWFGDTIEHRARQATT